MSNNNQNQAMQRFFEFVFNVPGDCFCCTWSISCFLETVEHMEGDKRWRSICTLGMSLLSLTIVFLLTLALCPKYYWSEINQIVMVNHTSVTPHMNYSYSTYIPTMIDINDRNDTIVSHTLSSPVNELVPSEDIPYNLTKHTVMFEHIGLHLNLWHINLCNKSYINDTFYKTYYNNTQYKGKIFINNTNTVTNETCSFITYRQSGTTSSTQDLSLWFIIFVIALLLLGCVCVLGTHPLFDRCHHKNAGLRSSIQKILAIAITILCACILNWSSFVFAAVFEHQVERYKEWQEPQPITQSNLGTGMLSVNGAMLLGIILSVIHCGAPIRSESGNQSPNQNQNGNNNGVQSEEQSHEQSRSTQSQSQSRTRLSQQQRMLLRHIPGGSSTVSNMAILTNPEHWFKGNDGIVNVNGDVTVNININVTNDRKDNKSEDCDCECECEEVKSSGNNEDMKEFEYQNMDVTIERKYNTNLSMKRIRKKENSKNKKDKFKKNIKNVSNEKRKGLLLNESKSAMPSLTPITSIDIESISGTNSENEID